MFWYGAIKVWAKLKEGVRFEAADVRRRGGTLEAQEPADVQGWGGTCWFGRNNAELMLKAGLIGAWRAGTVACLKGVE
jgi:hypothetical protein